MSSRTVVTSSGPVKAERFWGRLWHLPQAALDWWSFVARVDEDADPLAQWLRAPVRIPIALAHEAYHHAACRNCCSWGFDCGACGVDA